MNTNIEPFLDQKGYFLETNWRKKKFRDTTLHTMNIQAAKYCESIAMFFIKCWIVYDHLQVI